MSRARIGCALLLLSAFACMSGAAAFGQLLKQVEKEFIAYAKAARSCCVQVNVTQRVKFNPPPLFGTPHMKTGIKERERSLSGTLLDEKGYVVTLGEALKETVRVSVGIPDGDNGLQRFKAEIIGIDMDSNLGLIRILDKTFTALLPLGDSDTLAQGALVMGMGFSYDLGPSPSFSVGVINALDRSFQFDGHKEKLTKLLQTSLALRPGEPGGPVVNTSLEVVGVLLATYPRSGGYPASLGLGQQGVTVVMPINLVKQKVEWVLAQQRDGAGDAHKVEHGTVWLGLTAGNITDPALRKQLVIPTGGVLISDVYPGDPAASAGVKSNDVLITWNDTTVKGLDHLRELLSATQVGEKVTLLVIRSGEKHSIEVVVGKY